MPSSSRPGIGRSRHAVAPPASTSASKSACRSATGMSTPTSTPVRNFVPSALIWSSRRSMWRFSILNSGMPYRSRPPSRSARSNTVTSWPARVSCCAAARPAGPEPTTATLRPVREAGSSGRTQPISKALSMIATSTCLIVTGSALMPSTHAPSHGAGHSLPVNSGKLLVACSRSMASCQRSRYTRSFQSGMMLPSGQPELQNGTPQSMQRLAWVRKSSSANGSYTSRQSRRRTGTGRRVGSSRSCRMNPRISPMFDPAPSHAQPP